MPTGSPTPKQHRLATPFSTGNALPVLAEVAAALDRLLAGGAPTVIDLGAIPFAGGDERMLDEILGPGEVSATLPVMGRSTVRETGIAGVWLIEHLDEEGEILSRFIEVTWIPEILKTDPRDAARGLEVLRARLDACGPAAET